MTVAVFRRKAIVPLGVFLALVLAAWVLFADRAGRLAVERGGTAVLGARVEVRSFHISLAHGDVTIRGLVVASPFDSLRNLVEAEELVADLDVLPLLEKKVVIDRLAANGLRFGTPRTTSGFVPSAGPSATQRIRENVRAWAAQPALQAPALRLASGALSVDSLDPRRLATIEAAESLGTRVDSTRRAWSDALAQLDLRGVADSARSLAGRLRGARPTDVRLIGDARRALDRLKRTREQVTGLERSIEAGRDALARGLAALDAARATDYAFARSLVRLPTIDASAIGWVLFGPSAVRTYQRALYYTQLARAYMPPGLLPRGRPGPRRARRPGTAVEFPREREWPGFLLRDAELSLLLGDDAAGPRRYSGRLRGLTSAPALYGRPTTLDVRAPTLSADAVFDHVTAPPRDAVGATLRGVTLPDIPLPALPIRLIPGKGEVTFGFALYGDSLRARWDVTASGVRWRRDSVAAGGGAESEIADLVWRVVSEVGTLALSTELAGTVDHPALRVRSNLDQAVADRLRAVAGEAVAAAEARLRAQVDQLADQAVTPVRDRVDGVTAEASERLREGRRALDEAQRGLEEQLRRLTRGLGLP